MSDAYLGEIKLFSGNYAPQDWRICDGSMLDVNSYQALFSLLGTIYGGDGVNTFALPDLRGRVPVGQGQGTDLTDRVLGQSGGSETATVSEAQLPAHTHVWQVSTGPGSTNVPGPTAMLAKPAGTTNACNLYRAGSESGITYTAGPTDMISTAGSGAAHPNVMPSMALNYIICVQNGAFPQRAN
ncbi:MAG TPA: tail fiber protein [Gallionella sp.]|nr:tail fiber protein [Gallionella sp.]